MDRRIKSFRRGIPVERFANHLKADSQIGQERSRPGAGRDDQARRAVHAAVGFDGDAGPVRLPTADAFANSQCGSALDGLIGGRADAIFDVEIPGPLFKRVPRADGGFAHRGSGR